MTPAPVPTRSRGAPHAATSRVPSTESLSCRVTNRTDTPSDIAYPAEDSGLKVSAKPRIAISERGRKQDDMVAGPEVPIAGIEATTPSVDPRDMANDRVGRVYNRLSCTPHPEGDVRLLAKTGSGIEVANPSEFLNGTHANGHVRTEEVVDLDGSPGSAAKCPVSRPSGNKRPILRSLRVPPPAVVPGSTAHGSDTLVRVRRAAARATRARRRRHRR